jgi:hypothetical protein
MGDKIVPYSNITFVKVKAKSIIIIIPSGINANKRNKQSGASGERRRSGCK